MKQIIFVAVLMAGMPLFSQITKSVTITSELETGKRDSTYILELSLSGIPELSRYVFADIVNTETQIIATQLRYDLQSDQICTPGTSFRLDEAGVTHLILGRYNRFVLGNLVMLRFKDESHILLEEATTIIE